MSLSLPSHLADYSGVHWDLPIHSFRNSQSGFHFNHNPKCPEAWEISLTCANQHCKMVPLRESGTIVTSKCTYSQILSMGTIRFPFFKGHLGTNFLPNLQDKCKKTYHTTFLKGYSKFRRHWHIGHIFRLWRKGKNLHSVWKHYNSQTSATS